MNFFVFSCFFLFFVISFSHSLFIDTVIRDELGLWDPNHHGLIWDDVIQRVDRLLQVNTPNHIVPLPLNGICGPRASDTSANFTVDQGHRGPGNTIHLSSNDSLIVFIYTDVYNGGCMGGNYIAYAEICASEMGTLDTPVGRPVMGYMNLCMPGKLCKNTLQITSKGTSLCITLMAYIPRM